MIRLLSIAFGAILAMAALALVVAPRDEAAPRTASAAEAPADSDTVRPADQIGEAMVLKRDGSGQFHLMAQVNGQDVRFLVDTGADVVALTLEDAEALGINVDTGSLKPMIQTASGTGYGAPVSVDELTFGGSTFRDVPAIVVDGLQVNLLGQNVLRKLGKVELSGDRMVIRH